MRNGPETGRSNPSRVTSTAAKFTALLLAAIASSSGCAESTPTGFSTYKAARNCLEDKNKFPDLPESCKDRPRLLEEVLGTPAIPAKDGVPAKEAVSGKCGLPPGDSTVKLGDSTVTVRSRAEEAIGEVCK